MRSRWTQYLSLDVHKFTGPEGLSAHYLKKVAVEIVVPLTFLYKKSLQQGIVPQALSSPIHKSGSVDEPSNFRPIPVVSVVAKILEKIVLTQLSSYLEDHKSLHTLQGVYRHGKNTEDILLVGVNSIG